MPKTQSVKLMVNKTPKHLVQTEAAISRLVVHKWQNKVVTKKDDWVAEEVPVALVYNGISHAVMLATPQDLSDFALGFSLTEGIIEKPSQCYGVEVKKSAQGITLEIEISSEHFARLKERRRSLTGRTGCGLCGTESLEYALRFPTHPIDSKYLFSEECLLKAIKQAENLQPLQTKTGAVHASFWVDTNGQILLVREDVGRHNALDKLVGAMAHQEKQLGFVMTSSRASYEMVQKTYASGAQMLVAMSAPTGLAVRMADEYGLTLVGFARPNQYVVYTHPERLDI
jgi:FdhD protein